jgi:hypothetical protein
MYSDSIDLIKGVLYIHFSLVLNMVVRGYVKVKL